MSNEGKMTASKVNSVIFKDKANAPAMRKMASLFPGLGYAAGYKVRLYKWEGGKGAIADWLKDITTDIQIWWTAIRA